MLADTRTLAAMLARIWLTGHEFMFAVLAGVARLARAVITTLRVTAGTGDARVLAAFVHVEFAVNAFVAVAAQTLKSEMS